MSTTARRTFVLIGGEYIDATLGVTILCHRPDPNERPRWERVIDFARRLWDQDVTGLFFINASNGRLRGRSIRRCRASASARSSGAH